MNVGFFKATNFHPNVNSFTPNCHFDDVCTLIYIFYYIRMQKDIIGSDNKIR